MADWITMQLLAPPIPVRAQPISHPALPLKSRLRPIALGSWLLSSLLCTAAARAQSAADITCNRGDGRYSTTFQTGVTVSVSPSRAAGFSARTCEAKLTWAGGELDVAGGAAQIGIDLLGSGLGFRVPVVSFLVRTTASDEESEYRIYSLQQPPTLLRALRGGDFYRAADTNMDGHLEIWTDDTQAVDGFENIPAAILDFPPTVVLRVENQKLIDVSAQFQPFYDRQIARIRARLDARALADFRNTDGRLTPSAMPSDASLEAMLRVKAQVLEIAWSYLYSGRQAEAEQALAAMWPPADLARIRPLLLSLPTRGILRQVDGTDRKKGIRLFKAHIDVYDFTQPKQEASAAGTTLSSPIGLVNLDKQAAVSEPKPILLRRPQQDKTVPLDPNEVLELVVDEAGKVNSARVLSGTDTSLMAASSGWQFIPAFRSGEAVACRFRLHARDLQ